MSRALWRPAPWIAASALNAAPIGLLWIMVSKPGWVQSIAAVVGTAVLGAVIGALVVRRRP